MVNLVSQVLEPTIGNYFRNSAQDSDVIAFLGTRKERQQSARDHIGKVLEQYNVYGVDTLIGDIVPPEALMKTWFTFYPKMAERFQLPLITLIDTPGAYPGVGAEERGQSEAIARNLFEMAQLKAPIISIVIGEGSSGGALGIGVCDRLIMLQYSIYCVISPDG